MTRKNFKYPWHLLTRRGDFFLTTSPIDKVSKAAAMHFALRRPDEIVRCIKCSHDVFVVLVEASVRDTSKLYPEMMEYENQDKDIVVGQGSRVVENTIQVNDNDEDDEEDNSFEEVLE